MVLSLNLLTRSASNGMGSIMVQKTSAYLMRKHTCWSHLSQMLISYTRSNKINSRSCPTRGVDQNPSFGHFRRVWGVRANVGLILVDTVLTTVVIKFDKNPTRIPIAWCFKLANSATSCDKIESASLYPSEIWQPWCPNFGNPENQIAYLQVFEHA